MACSFEGKKLSLENLFQEMQAEGSIPLSITFDEFLKLDVGVHSRGNLIYAFSQAQLEGLIPVGTTFDEFEQYNTSDVENLNTEFLDHLLNSLDLDLLMEIILNKDKKENFDALQEIWAELVNSGTFDDYPFIQFNNFFIFIHQITWQDFYLKLVDNELIRMIRTDPAYLEYLYEYGLRNKTIPINVTYYEFEELLKLYCSTYFASESEEKRNLNGIDYIIESAHTSCRAIAVLFNDPEKAKLIRKKWLGSRL